MDCIHRNSHGIKGDCKLNSRRLRSISRRRDKGCSGGFGTRSRGVWVRNLTLSGIGRRDVTMPDRRTREPTFQSENQMIDSDTRVIMRS